MIATRVEIHDLIADLLRLPSRSPMTSRLLRQLEDAYAQMDQHRLAGLLVQLKDRSRNKLYMPTG